MSVYQILNPHPLALPNTTRLWLQPGVPIQIGRRAVMAVYFDRAHGRNRYSVMLRVNTPKVRFDRHWDTTQWAPLDGAFTGMIAWQRAVKITHGKPGALLIEIAPIPIARVGDEPHPGSGLAS